MSARSSLRHLSSSLIIALWVGLSLSPLWAQTTTVVVKTGDSAPDGNGLFATGFSIPSLNNFGQVTFGATLTNTSGGIHDDTGVFGGDGIGPLWQYAREDAAAPDGNGDFSNLFTDQLQINSLGHVVFTGDLHFTTGPSRYGLFFSNGSGPLVQIARELQGSPDGNGRFINTFVGYSFAENGHIAFSAQLNNTNGGNADDGGYFLSNSAGTLTTIVREGDPAPDGNGIYRPLSGPPQVNASGLVAYSSEFTATSSGLNELAVVVNDGTSATIIARSGQSISAGGTFQGGMNSFALNDSGEVAFMAGIEGVVGAGVFRGDGVSPVVEISRGGNPSPDGNGVIDGHSEVVINASGLVAFEASISEGANRDSSIFLGDGTVAAQIIARSRQAVPDGNGDFSDFNFTLNDSGQLAFFAGLQNTASPQNDNFGIYFYDESLGLIKVARLGDPLLGSTITRLNFASGIDYDQPGNQQTGLNILGQVAYRFELASGEWGIALWSGPDSGPLLVSGDRPGANTTDHGMAYDGDLGTFFKSSYFDWQYLQIDFGKPRPFWGIRRYMTRDGVDIAGSRTTQGETALYSVDGTQWVEFTALNASGWDGYINYGARQHAWRDVPYGWSEWLVLDSPVLARYVRYSWDGDNDALNEVEVAGMDPGADKTLSPTDFVSDADVIDFDNLRKGADLDFQLRIYGVRIQSENGNPAVVFDPSEKGSKSHSLPFAAANASGSPLEFSFKVPRSKVGMYFGNIDAVGETKAILLAYDDSGSVVGESVVSIEAGMALDVSHFIGVGVASPVISRVTLDFENETVPKIIDDLMIEPGQSHLDPVTEAIPALIAQLETGSVTERLNAIDELTLRPSTGASVALQDAAEKDPDPYVQTWAVHALIQLHDANAIPALVSIGLNTADPDVRRIAYNAVWALRESFPLPDPLRITLQALTPPKPNENFKVEARVFSPVDRDYVQLKFRSSKDVYLLGGNQRADTYTGPMSAGQEIVLEATCRTVEVGQKLVPFSARITENWVDAESYETPLYLDVQTSGGTSQMEPFPGWDEVTSPVYSLDPKVPLGEKNLYTKAADGDKRDAIVSGNLFYEDGDPRQFNGFTPVGEHKPGRLMKVQVVDRNDFGKRFGEGWTDWTGAFRIPVEDVPSNMALAVVLEVDNFVNKVYSDTDLGDEEFRFQTGQFNSGTSGPIQAGDIHVWASYFKVDVDENGIIPGGGEKHNVTFAAAMNINEVLLISWDDIQDNRDPSEGDSIGKVDVEYCDSAWNHYFQDIVLSCAGIDQQHHQPGDNAPLGVDYGFVDKTIAHEYMHHLQYEIGSWDSHPEAGGHSLCKENDLLFSNDPEISWSEGLADYFGNHIVYLNPGMSSEFAGDLEDACGTFGSDVTNWTGEGESSYSIEGHIAGALWDLADGWGQGSDAWDQVNGEAFNGHQSILQIFDKEMGDSHILGGITEDAADIREFYDAWIGRFGRNSLENGQPVWDAILNRFAIVPQGDEAGGTKRNQPYPIVEPMPVLPDRTAARVVLNPNTVNQYDQLVSAVHVPGSPVVAFRRNWSYLDSLPLGPNPAADVVTFKIGMSNLRDGNMGVDKAGSGNESSTAAFTANIQFGPGGSGWLEVSPASGNFNSAEHGLVPLNIKFLPSAFDLPGNQTYGRVILNGGVEYTADVVLNFTAGSQSHERIIRVKFNQLIGPDNDTDGDGLTNREERDLADSDPGNFGCLDPLSPDSDGDGLMDLDEINGDPIFGYKSSPCLLDTDGDLIPDGLEVLFGECLHPSFPEIDVDVDDDGLNNRFEAIYPSMLLNPCNPDVDGDGALDGVDNCPFTFNDDQRDIDKDGFGDVCDSDKDGDGCANLYDPNPDAVDTPESGCLARPADPNLSKDGRLITEHDPRLDDPRWRLFLDGFRPFGENSCGDLTCPPPSVSLLDDQQSVVTTVFADDLGFNQESGFALEALLVNDRDGDKIPDIAIGAPLDNVGKGQVVIVSGATGEELGRIAGEVEGGFFGSSMAFWTEGEIAIGAPAGEGIAGAVHLVDLANFQPYYTLTQNELGDGFGTSVLSVSDLGEEALAIGSPNHSGHGAVYKWKETGSTEKFLEGSTLGEKFGYSLARGGDNFDDKIEEIIVGAPGPGDFPPPVGQAYLASAPTEGQENIGGRVVLASLDGQIYWECYAADSGAQFGLSVSAIKDAHGKALYFLAGAPGLNNNTGRVYLLSLDGEIIQTIEGMAEGAKMGNYVSAGPDYNGDGIPSIVLVETGLTGPQGLPGLATLFQVFTTPQVLEFVYRDDQYFFRIMLEENAFYSLQRSSNLKDWETLISFSPDDEVHTLSLGKDAELSEKFFRVISQKSE